MRLRIGDKVKYKNFDIDGHITEYKDNYYVINGTLLATDSEIELYKEPIPENACNCSMQVLITTGCKIHV